MDAGSQPPESGAMAQNHPGNRAPSRASTASVHSNATQPNLEQSFVAAAHAAYPDQWNTNGHGQQPREMVQAGHQMPAEDIMLRPASQMQPTPMQAAVMQVQQMHGAQQSFSMDSSMQSSVGHGMSYSQHQHSAMGHHGLPTESFGPNASFTEPDSQIMDRDDNEDGDSLAGLPPNPKPSNKTSANNELEMRMLFQGNKHRTLQEVAAELHGNERGPNSERTRQVFAMLWISQVCSKGKGSVPRGRVYANYASRCATERTTVLNPASFGKLVRVLFPGLKTRRLGVRGESKYHYVNFTLMDDQPDTTQSAIQPAIPFPDAASFSQSMNNQRSQSPAVNVPKAAHPMPQPPQQPDVAATFCRSSQGRSHSLYNQPDVSSIDQLQSTTSKTMLGLSFSPDQEPFRSSDALVLPKIEPFLPPGADADAALSLTALYRSHCTSLVECIRYCKEKTFFHLYTSFQGTLTMPVQKLFSNPSVAPWIEQCDFVLYQRMMRIISGLTLQVVPKPVLDTLRNISERLVLHIRESFQGQPRHVVQAKEAPATIFAGLLDRALRVNLTAHAAANMLSLPANRDQMYSDWITMVRIRKVAECVPTRGMDDVVNLLLTELRDLLDPQHVPWELEIQTLYGEFAARNNRTVQNDGFGDDSAHNVLDRWVSFLRSLPTRFPYASPEDIVWCVQRVGTEVMRDLTIAQGKSFGSWWVTKCWIDEMISFLAEQGGFMQSKSSSPPAATVPKRPLPTKDTTSRQDSHIAEDFNSMPTVSQSQLSRTPFSAQVDTNRRGSLGLSANPDDSGIGMRTPDDEFRIDKFDLPQNHGDGIQTNGLDAEY